MIDLKKYKVHFLLSLAIAICFSSLIIADGRYYIDDYGRSISGYAAWTMNGRPLAEMFMIALNFGMPLPDLFPIPQVIAVIAFAIAMTIFSYKTSKEHVYCAVIAAAFIIASPTIISNLSYRYDSATMALSVLAATASSLLWYNRCIKNAVISFIVLLATLCLYQPSSNIFVLLSVYSYLISEDDRRGAFINLMVKGIVFILANAFYFIAIVPMTISDDYNTTGSQLPEFHSVVDVIIRNTIAFSNIILDCLSHLGFVIVSLIALISTASVVMHIYKEHRNWMFSVIHALIRILFIPFSAFMIVGSIAILMNPVFHPRVLISSGFALAVIVGICINSASVLRFFAIFCSIVLLMYLIGLFASFSNTQKAQENYESWIIQSIADDLASAQTVKSLMIVGNPGYAPVSSISIEKYPIIKRTIRILINGSDPWGMYQLRHFGINIKYPSAKRRKEVLESYCQSEKKYRPAYVFSVYRDIAVVDFTKSCK